MIIKEFFQGKLIFSTNHNSTRSLSRCPSIETVLIMKQKTAQSFTGKINSINKQNQAEVGIYGCQFNIGNGTPVMAIADLMTNLNSLLLKLLLSGTTAGKLNKNFLFLF